MYLCVLKLFKAWSTCPWPRPPLPVSATPHSFRTLHTFSIPSHRARSTPWPSAAHSDARLLAAATRAACLRQAVANERGWPRSTRELAPLGRCGMKFGSVRAWVMLASDWGLLASCLCTVVRMMFVALSSRVGLHCMPLPLVVVVVRCVMALCLSLQYVRYAMPRSACWFSRPPRIRMACKPCCLCCARCDAS
jgi:hypothetical protein